MSSTFFNENIDFSDSFSKTTPLPQGTILVNDGTGKFEELSPGANDTVLTVNSSSPTGLSWLNTPWIIFNGVNQSTLQPATTTNSRVIVSDPTTNFINAVIDNASIISGVNNTMNCAVTDPTPPELCSIIASDTCTIQDQQPNTGPNGPRTSCITSSNNCIIEGSRTANRFIAAGSNCRISTTFGSGTSLPSAIIGSQNCTTGTDQMIGCSDVTAVLTNGWTQNSLISCINMGTPGAPVPLGTRNVYLSSSNVISTLSSSNNLIKAWNADVQNFGGCTMLSDTDTSGPVLTLSTNNEFVCRFVNGYRFYSNSALTSGSIMASGGGWSTLSDENIKENLVRLDEAECSNISNKLISMDVCKYNYIGNPQEQVCYGPTAQDWHREFGSEFIPVARKENILKEDGEVVEEYILDEEGNQIYDSKPAKDPSVIEYSDMLGVLMATVKDLNRRLNAVKPPELYFINEPLNTTYSPVGLGDIGTKVFEYTCPKTGKLSLVASGCFQKISGNEGTMFIQLRLNDQLFSPSVQSGYEGEQSSFAPDLSGLTINWCGEVNEGDVLTVYGLATSGSFSLRQSGLYGGAAGAQLSITQY